MRALALLLLLPMLALAEDEVPSPAARQTALEARVVLKVVHPDQVRRALIQAAKDAGGFHTLVTDETLVLKVPPERLGELLRGVGDHGLVIEKTLSRNDLTEGIANLEGRLRSKQAISGKLREFFDKSDLVATLDIERNLNQIVLEMEELEGLLRVERERARWGIVSVAFRFPKRDRIVYVHSPFEWLNTVDLGRFLSDFGAD